MRRTRRLKGKQKPRGNRAATVKHSRPRDVYVAVRKLLNTAHQVQARAAELESTLQTLRERERSRAMKDLLSALRDTSAGNLIRVPPDWDGEDGPSADVKGMLEALMEAFPIKPVGRVGDRLAVRAGQISEAVELDRAVGECADECVAVEVVSVGWSYGGKVLLKPIARPLHRGEA